MVLQKRTHWDARPLVAPAFAICILFPNGAQVDREVLQFVSAFIESLIENKRFSRHPQSLGVCPRYLIWSERAWGARNLESETMEWKWWKDKQMDC